MGIVGVDFREFGLSSGENRKLNSVTTSMTSAKHKHVLQVCDGILEQLQKYY